MYRYNNAEWSDGLFMNMNMFDEILEELNASPDWGEQDLFTFLAKINGKCSEFDHCRKKRKTQKGFEGILEEGPSLRQVKQKGPYVPFQTPTEPLHHLENKFWTLLTG